MSTRALVACVLLLAATAATTLLALMTGKVGYSPGEVLAALVGDAPADVELFVVRWRLPRAVAAVTFGAVLGVAGALFQCVTRNPLGSPDIIGFSAGASAGGVAAVTLIGSSFAVVAAGTLIGGLLVAALIMLLSRGGGTGGFRLVIVGIGLSAMLVSVESWLVLTADLDVAQVAALWSVGTLNGTSFTHSGIAMALGIAAVVAVIVLLSRRLTLLDLGEDLSGALGADPLRTRTVAVLAGVLLIAIVTAAAGPIAFVALAAPHIGRRLAGMAGVALVPAACTGAFLLALSDFVAQHALPGRMLPVGVVTVAVGGLYLITLIVRENRKGVL
ncbi:iron-enterobactin ABC transporter permease [Aeromicrobium camelliae]|uniref:Iron-enterobactin ABC transporter permease n=2 Tax=Aeromicrobium camelliae TaxID=1538144 RepID=A0A3N6WS35_9ACTN|nr:iron-enterobactin ABC transporter permease [Aeromicrobium camelliae]